MTKSTDIRIRDVAVSNEKYIYRAAVKFGGRVVTDAVVVNVRMRVETRDGRVGHGFGSMPMGNAWAWPSRILNGDQTLAAAAAKPRRCANSH